METQQAYLEVLEELASRKGEDYAMRTAAVTISTLLSMVSRGAYRLPEMPLFLAPEEGEGEEQKQDG